MQNEPVLNIWESKLLLPLKIWKQLPKYTTLYTLSIHMSALAFWNPGSESESSKISAWMFRYRESYMPASRQRSIKMFCSSTIICSVCFVRKSLFQIGNKWSAIEFLFLNEATSQTAFLYLGWSPYRYFKEISAVFFISEKKEIERYITNRKLLVFLFFFNLGL